MTIILVPLLRKNEIKKCAYDKENYMSLRLVGDLNGLFFLMVIIDIGFGLSHNAI